MADESLSEQPSGLKVVALVGLLLLMAGIALALDLAERGARRSSAAQVAVLTPPPPDLRLDAIQTSDPAALAPVAPDEAERRNAAIAVSSEPLVPALPFEARSVPAADVTRALDCLTLAVYYEAASESDAGQRGVAQVVLNRVRHVAFPGTVCGVVFQGSERSTGCQFSFTCDGSMARVPSPQGLARARGAAAAVFYGFVERSVGLATHYHTKQVFPYWSPKLVKLNTLGAHIFLRWPGDWGQPRAFLRRYTGGEPAMGTIATELVAEPLAEDAAVTTADGNNKPLPTQWDRPLLRTGNEDAIARSEREKAAAFIPERERRILGIENEANTAPAAP